MVSKRDLQNLRELKRRQKTVEERILHLRSSVLRTSPNLDGLPHGGAYKDAMAEYVAKLDQLQWDMIKIETRLNEEIIRVEDAIRRLPTQQCAVIWMRYVENKSWNRIKNELHYERTWVFETHAKALKALMKSPD